MTATCQHQMAGVTSRVAVVTGSASQRGIGAATATRLLRDGWRVAMLDLASSALDEARDRILGNGIDPDRVATLPCDVTSSSDVAMAVASILKRFNQIDALVNNAGITAPTRLADISEVEWDQIFAVDVKGVFLMTQAVLPSMRQRAYGRIVNVSSVSGKRGGGLFGGAHYSAAKAAVLGFTKSVAREVAAEGITSNAVAPGMIDTDITAGMLSEEQKLSRAAAIPLGRLGRADEVADVIAYLCSEGASYITGEDIDINGGFHMD